MRKCGGDYALELRAKKKGPLLSKRPLILADGCRATDNLQNRRSQPAENNGGRDGYFANPLPYILQIADSLDA